MYLLYRNAQSTVSFYVFVISQCTKYTFILCICYMAMHKIHHFVYLLYRNAQNIPSFYVFVISQCTKFTFILCICYIAMHKVHFHFMYLLYCNAQSTLSFYVSVISQCTKYTLIPLGAIRGSLHKSLDRSDAESLSWFACCQQISAIFTSILPDYLLQCLLRHNPHSVIGTINNCLFICL